MQDILRGERNIINSSQEIEIISFFILIRYSEVINGVNYSDNNQINKDNYIYYCENTLSNEFVSKVDKEFFGEVGVLFSSLRNVLSKINFNVIHHYILPILSEISVKEDFSILASEYRLMIKAMAFDSPQLGQFYTPATMAEVLVNIIKPKYGGRIYDPSCGSSGFLLEASKYILNNVPEVKYELIGSDISIFASLISFTNLILSGEKYFNLNIGDSINKVMGKYDYILANPPFGKLKYKNEIVCGDGLQYIDYIFLKHIMESLQEGGQAAVILPERFFHDNNKYCMELKNDLFNNFSIESIISIPPGSMLPATGVKIIILHFSNHPPRKDFWIYVLDSVEKFSRKNPITLSHFDDFFSKIKGRVISDNSWLVSTKNLKHDFNIFERNSDEKFFHELESPKDYVNQLFKQQENLLMSLNYISEKIEEINKKISERKNDFRFVSFKLGDLAKSRSTKPLSRELLSNKNGYSVYGGNGVIGFYKEFILQGKFIIIGRVGAYCGNVRYVEGEIWATNNAIVLECCRPDVINPSYLAKILERKALRGLATGTAQPHLTISKINDVDIYLPPLEIQIEINNWLNQLEEVFLSQHKNISNILNSKGNVRDSIYQNLLRL
ncbi:N-6 DNA methylase [Acinetobacter radioresistens]|uniref:N-6 DNA methylase n=1 Tax=Acinetobacter radioresistens TaxID=40216 RepID=UPI002005079C|nr:N-6 DNA methylase [Acinetobacter radioresistens]MCK4107718.1 N-6 DNA methylase [Acinetobacter radioresistens]